MSVSSAPPPHRDSFSGLTMEQNQCFSLMLLTSLRLAPSLTCVGFLGVLSQLPHCNAPVWAAPPAPFPLSALLPWASPSDAFYTLDLQKPSGLNCICFIPSVIFYFPYRTVREATRNESWDLGLEGS